MTDEDAGESLTANDFETGLRLGLAQSLGQTGFNEKDYARNHYEVFGWPRDDLDGWGDEEWLALYLRNGYAKVVNDKPAFTTWRDEPVILDNSGSDTEFETQVEKLARNHDIWTYAERVDRAAGIGEHGLLLVSLTDVENDSTQWQEDATDSFNSLDDVNAYKPVLQKQIEDIDWGGPEDGERWGKPVEYTVDLDEDIDDNTEGDNEGTINVHHSRVVDVPATRLLDDETLARPRAEPVLNNLLDIEKTLGAVAEAAYRAADYGLHINADPSEVDFSDGADELRDELERYEQDLQRYIRTQGVDVERLGGDVQDPSGIIERNLDEISATTNIPKRELRGNQQGEQAGAQQDEKSYFGTIEERREQFAAPLIVRRIIDTHRNVGVLTDPGGDGYSVEWPDLTHHSEKERAELRAARSRIVNNLFKAGITLSQEEAISIVERGDYPTENDPIEDVANAAEFTETDIEQFKESIDQPDLPITENAD